MYVDLGKHTGIFHGGNGTISSTVNGRFDVLDTMWIVRAGVNYKFGGQNSSPAHSRESGNPDKFDQD